MAEVILLLFSLWGLIKTSSLGVLVLGERSGFRPKAADDDAVLEKADGLLKPNLFFSKGIRLSSFCWLVVAVVVVR